MACIGERVRPRAPYSAPRGIHTDARGDPITSCCPMCRARAHGTAGEAPALPRCTPSSDGFDAIGLPFQG